MLVTSKVLIPKLEIYDMRKNILAILSDNTPDTATGINVTYNINDSATLSFNLPSRNPKVKHLVNENLVKMNDDYYIIKKVSLDSEKKTFSVSCTHESCSLKDKLCGKFEIPAMTARELITEVLKGTEWQFGETDVPDTKKRHLFSNEASVFANLTSIVQNFDATYGWLEFRTENIGGKDVRTVSLYTTPRDRGKYVRKRKGLKTIDLNYDTTQMVTRLTMFGKTDSATGMEYNMMSVHPEKKSYVDDFSFFTKQGYVQADFDSQPTKFVKELIIRDNELPSDQAVYDAALDKIKKLAVPKVDASVTIFDISVMPDYLETPPSLGENLKVIDDDIDLILDARIVSISKNYDTPLDIQVGISNVIETNSVIKSLVESSNTVERVTDTVTQQIIGTWIKEATIGTAQIRDLSADKITSGSIATERLSANIIAAINASIGTAKIDSAKIADLQAVNAVVTDLKALKAEFGKFTAMAGTIDELVAQHVTSASATTIKQITKSTVIDDAIIKNAMIDSINAGKITSGNIDTSVVTIVGDHNKMSIRDGTIQISDDTRPRLQMGKTATGEYDVNIWDASGNLLFDAIHGITEHAITSPIIRNDMVSNTANISADKLDINSLFRVINADGSRTLSASKIRFDDSGQSLTVAFDKMQTEIENASSRNLIRGSREFKIDTNRVKGFAQLPSNCTLSVEDSFTIAKLVANGNSQDANYEILSNYFTAGKDDEFTISFLVKVDNISSWDTKTLGGIRFFDTSNNKTEETKIDGTTTVTSAGQWVKISQSYKVTGTQTVKACAFLELARNGQISFQRLKVEKGVQVKPEWTLAPEDIIDGIDALRDSEGQASVKLYAPKGNAFKNQKVDFLILRADFINGNKIVNTNKEFNWFTMDESITTDQGGGVGWKKIVQATGEYEFTQNNELKIFNKVVESENTIKVIVKDTDVNSNTFSITVFDMITILDTSDPIQVLIVPSNGNIFKNGSGAKLLMCTLIRGTEEIDIDLSKLNYDYKWYKYDKDGNKVADFGGKGIDFKSGKALTVTSAEVDSMATFDVVVSTK